MTVRRLTVAECERLQGFPDSYTRIPTGKRRRLDPDELDYLRRIVPGLTEAEAIKMASDGPCYMALGNSMAVNVMRYLGERIEAVEGQARDMRRAAE